jgi:hypothetical protein
LANRIDPRKHYVFKEKIQVASNANALIINKKAYKPGLNARGLPSRDQNRPEVDNRTFAGTNQQFKDACSAAGVQPTKRQASKFRRKLGAAFKGK